ncbi:LPXTG cell wall anchor domain-containing protein [Micromonospora auratinigra]|uniref:LPXTG-motif cell wall anchor domain-containing protein n=1 Tax=Micromonospora auratinigra TaxID=261654 RepID=A0A1A9A4H2_9ACTN|nr:LPXTG cell wall anchor domain-containing protein [Micromonospora auratinigra]SBT50998.1 LPXTG-motif cell wall anchor domain-containing protein [Micromonospora auratinigra]
MRRTVSAGVLVALAMLIPAAPATATAPVSAPTGLNEACQTVERKVYKDIRELIKIDLDTATTTQVRLLANQILFEANTEGLPTLPGALQKRLNGTADDLRAFLKSDVLAIWSTDLRVSVDQTMTGAGTHVKEAAQLVLDTGDTDAFLAYLNDGLYVARALDCQSQPTPSPTPTATSTPSATPGATSTGAPVPTSSTSPGAPGGEGGGLPLTGTDAGTLAGIGGALLLLGGGGYLLGRRRRTRFSA